MTLLPYLMCLLLLLNSCSDETIIAVDIDVDRTTMDNKLIGKTDFEYKLKTKIDSLVKSGFNRSRIYVRVTADKHIPEYEMSEVEKAIRRQGVTRAYYWTD